jgi:hypothetical protein
MCLYFGMDSLQVADEFANLLVNMSKGAYLLMCAAIDASGGELRVNPGDFARRALEKAPVIEVDGTDGSVILRVQLPD